jgi:glucuronosyltransferase
VKEIKPNFSNKDLEDFVNGAGDDGFILMSFGSVLRGSELPEATRKVMISAFGRLKQRVLWKWEDDAGIKDLPPNVRLSAWLPQQDLLGKKT